MAGVSQAEMARIQRTTEKEVTTIKEAVGAALAPETVEGLKQFLAVSKSVNKLLKAAERAQANNRVIRLRAMGEKFLGTKNVVTTRVWGGSNPIERDWILYQLVESGNAKTIYTYGRYRPKSSSFTVRTARFTSEEHVIKLDGTHLPFRAPALSLFDNMLLACSGDRHYGQRPDVHELYLICKRDDVDKCMQIWTEMEHDLSLFKNRYILVTGGTLSIEELSAEIPFDKMVLPPELVDEYEFLGKLITSYKKQTKGIKRGVLFTGKPGTGKTSSLKAFFAKHKGAVTIFAVAGSTERHGWGGYSLEALYKMADEWGPSIVVLEDFDTIAGSSRDANPLIKQMLDILDGEIVYDNVLTVATTNLGVDDIDPAITRKGRFDRHIALPIPDLPARIAIAQNHADVYGCPLEPELLELICKSTETGAEIASYFRTAYQAAQAEDRSITKEDIEWAVGRETSTQIGFGR